MFGVRSTTTRFLFYLALLLATSCTAASLMRYQSFVQSLLAPFRSSAKMATPSLDLPRATASELQELLTAGKVKSSQLVEAYLSHIDKHEGYLNALIARPARQSLLQQAQQLDQERLQGNLRSRLHGIPVLIKVIPPVPPNFRMLMECRIIWTPCRPSGWTPQPGSFALAGAKPKKNSAVVERVCVRSIIAIVFEANLVPSLLNAGAIIIGQANLSVSRRIWSPN